MDAFFHYVLRDVVGHKFVVSAHTVAQTSCFHEFGAGSSGTPLDQKLILGHPTSGFMGQLYPVICRYPIKGEVVFWEKNFRNTGCPIWSHSPKPEVMTHSDV